jgi:hypothetical protein
MLSNSVKFDILFSVCSDPFPCVIAKTKICPSVTDNYVFRNKLEYLTMTVVKLYAFNLYTQRDYGLVLSRNMLLSSSFPNT